MMKKKRRIFVILLVAALALSACGKTDIENNTENNTENTVSDTKPPKVEVKTRYVFTNDITKLSDLASTLGSVEDESEFTVKLIRYEKKEALGRVNDLALKNLTEGVESFVDKEAALAVGSEEVPVQPGIYRGVVEIADVHGNAVYEEIIIILDTTPAKINDVADKTIEVAKDKLNDMPEIDKNDYKGVDEVDGPINADQLNITVELHDEAKHEWVVKVSYTDRAGNTGTGESYITVKEKEEKQTSSNAGTQKPNDSHAGNSDNGNTKPGNSNTGTTNPGNSNSGNTNPGNSESGTTKPTNPVPDNKYDPADTDRDGVVTDDERMSYITPEKQALIDAGYGVVLEFDGGTWCGVLMKSADHMIEGKTGYDIIRAYLDDRGLDGTLGGGWINPDNEWYWYIMEDIHEADDEIEWEW